MLVNHPCAYFNTRWRSSENQEENVAFLDSIQKTIHCSIRKTLQETIRTIFQPARKSAILLAVTKDRRQLTGDSTIVPYLVGGFNMNTTLDINVWFLVALCAICIILGMLLN